MRTSSSRQSSLANEIFSRRRKKVLVDPSAVADRILDERYVASVAKNLEALGYGMSARLIEACKQLTLDELVTLNEDLFRCLSKGKGAHLNHKPMYPNFPSQVMEMQRAELYLNALIHYVTSGQVLPQTEKKQRAPLIENTRLEVIDLGSVEEFEALFTQLATANTSLSPQDKEDLGWFVEHYGNDVERLLPQSVSNRENKAFLLARLIRHAPTVAHKAFSWCSTATDVLRVAVAMSNGDVSLAEPTRFKKYSRAERRMLLLLLQRQKNLIEDMLRWKTRWIRLGERLHPCEGRAKYPDVCAAFDVLRNNLPSRTFYSRLEKALLAMNLDEVLSLLPSRPGDFARRLDHVLRVWPERGQEIVPAFETIADRVSTPVLLQVRHHFKTRNQPADLRVFFPKGNVGKAKAVANLLDEISLAICAKLFDICETVLKNRFAKLAPLGPCFLDSSLMNFTVPFSQRSASKALRTISRGSRVPMSDADTLRFFVWWRNQATSRVDIDLSAASFNTKFYFESAITYYNLQEFGGCHSGDIVDAPEGASEFIDVSIEKCLAVPVRYIVMVLTSFSGQPYCDLPECFAGWMSRKKAQSGEIYEPRTVQNKFDISANTRLAIPVVFDLQKREAIWTDIALSNEPDWSNNVHSNLEGIQLALKAMVEMSKPNLYDLFKLHVDARGHLVDHPENATTVFSVANETPYQLEMIASEYMKD